MAARVSSLSLYSPDICYILFYDLSTSLPPASGLRVSACDLRVTHPV